MTTAAILLAGGESRRMGTLKPLLDWGGRCLVVYQVEQLREAGVDKVVVVLGHRADDVRPLVHEAGGFAVLNEMYGEGRASSVRVGAEALGDNTRTVVVLNVDQPRPAAVTRRLLEHHSGGNLISVPTFRGHQGHPVVLDGSLLPEMRNVREETLGLRAIIGQHMDEVSELEFDSDIVLLGMNTPDEYERARLAYFARTTEPLRE